jgi:hypothetical protein
MVKSSPALRTARPVYSSGEVLPPLFSIMNQRTMSNHSLGPTRPRSPDRQPRNHRHTFVVQAYSFSNVLVLDCEAKDRHYDLSSEIVPLRWDEDDHRCHFGYQMGIEFLLDGSSVPKHTMETSRVLRALYPVFDSRYKAIAESSSKPN